MKRVKQILSYLPEASIIVMATYWFLENLLSSPSFVNYVMVGIVGLVSILLIWKNKIMALLLSIIMGLACFYMLLAVFSEYKKFLKGDPDGLNLLLTGSLIFVTLIVFSFVMPVKYLRK
ncbi:hypothetical protein [Dysgonomonas sp. 216]|uniref:hypothetical protein n=1 Tax=Dysgonomonas sp. 216 TaxID=2302934 RepID=UPI0013D1F507|nr:hypothetical protein [Dysgonomonas sp. 216]